MGGSRKQRGSNQILELGCGGVRRRAWRPVLHVKSRSQMSTFFLMCLVPADSSLPFRKFLRILEDGQGFLL